MTTFDENKYAGRGAAPTEDVGESIKAKTAQVSADLKQKATQTLDQNRTTAADEIDSLAHAAHAAAADLQHHDREGLSQYVTELASNVTSLANNLRNKSVDELIHEAENIARNNPALFIGGSIAIGLGIARFAKASSHRRNDSANKTQQNDKAQDYETRNVNSLTGTSIDDDWLQPATTQSNGLSRSGNESQTLGGTRYE